MKYQISPLIWQIFFRLVLIDITGTFCTLCQQFLTGEF